MQNAYLMNEDGTTRRAKDMAEWANMFEDRNSRFIAQTKGAEHVVSTVFLGLDHNFTEDGPPLLFETMVFNTINWNNSNSLGLPELDCERYATKEEALAGHKAVCAKWGVDNVDTEC